MQILANQMVVQNFKSQAKHKAGAGFCKAVTHFEQCKMRQIFVLKLLPIQLSPIHVFVWTKNAILQFCTNAPLQLCTNAHLRQPLLNRGSNVIEP